VPPRSEPHWHVDAQRPDWLAGARDSNLRISESELAHPLKIRTNIAAIKANVCCLEMFSRVYECRTCFRDLSCSAVLQTSNNIPQK
jgi:hypothetical protein